jgi:hypothetical protein
MVVVVGKWSLLGGNRKLRFDSKLLNSYGGLDKFEFELNLPESLDLLEENLGHSGSKNEK